MERDQTDELIDRIATAVVARLEERRKIAAIADYVIAEMERRQAEGGNPEPNEARRDEQPQAAEEEPSGQQ